MSVYAFINLVRAEEERLRAARARSGSRRQAHLLLAQQFDERARLARE
jgi:hypothetical protein